MHNAGNPRRIVGSIRLELAAPQGLFKGQLLVHTLVDGICLVSIGHNGLVAQNSDRGVDDQAGVFHLGGIKGLSSDSSPLFHENPVPAVCASAHDKISGHGLCSVSRSSQNDPSSRIGVLFQFFC